MKTDLKITTVQSNLHWENVKDNLDMFSSKFMGLKEKTDLIVLPEMFTTGFSNNVQEIAEEMDGSAMDWLGNQAKKLNAVIMGTLVIKENGNFYNRLIWMRPDGTFDQYDKRHLFAMAGEHKHYTAGQKRLITEVKGWKVCPLTCYDLRFPVWSRNTVDYDLLIYTANWPERRSYAWKALLQARAVENQAWTVGVNRVGEDGLGIPYSGDSCIFDPMGEKAAYSCTNDEEIHTQPLSYETLIKIRESLPFLHDQGDYSINF